jgi:TonB family protein
MNEATTDVIVARSRDVDRLSTMLVWSIAAHVVITAAVMLTPRPAFDATPKNVMMISLGGAPGPRTGMTQMATSPVEAPKTEPVKPVEAPPTPPAPKMTLPDPTAKARARPKETSRESSPKEAVTDPEPQPRAARVRGKGFEGFGLSSGGGAGGGAVTLDVTDFCCQEYITEMVALITQNWNGKQNRVGVTTMKFTIHRNGRIDGIQLEKPSGIPALDAEAERALRVVRLPELPGRYTNPTLTVHLEFVYERR